MASTGSAKLKRGMDDWRALVLSLSPLLKAAQAERRSYFQCQAERWKVESVALAPVAQYNPHQEEIGRAHV